MGIDHGNSYSASVKLELRVGDRVFELAGTGPNDIILRHGIELDPCDADIAMFVNDQLFIWPVRIPNYVVPFEHQVITQSRGEMIRMGTVVPSDHLE